MKKLLFLKKNTSLASFQGFILDYCLISAATYFIFEEQEKQAFVKMHVT